MNMRLCVLTAALICVLLFAGCPWFRPNNPDDLEGEGEPPIEGESPVEGEPANEGEPVEGETEGEPMTEGEHEGEPSTELFTSADTYSSYRNDMDFVDEPTAEDEDGDAERELVEPDVIRQHDGLLYILNQYRGLTIVDLETELLLSQTPTFGYPRDLYLVGDRAYVLVSYACDITADGGFIAVSYGSKVYALNVADPANVLAEGAFTFTGDLVDSRMVGDIIYAVCSDYTYYETPEDGDDAVEIDSAQKSYGATWAVSLDIAEPANIVVADTVSFPGYGNLIQATNYAIFSVSADWDYGTGDYLSVINYIDITDPQGKIVMRGVANAPGHMADRFKMDAWEGVLRVVTNTWWPDRQTIITTFDISDPDRIEQLGRTILENASGESLFATRFDGPLAYIVTYLMVDPLFVVDLSDPMNPEVKGELKIPGWSTHIEPRGDRLIALGVDDTEGRRVMVSLFDVSDPAAPARIDYASFGENWSWSTAYSDVKAFTVLDDMLLIPFSGWNSGSGGYDRLQFVAYARDGLDAQGHVDLQGSAIRSFRSGDNYYAVTQEQLAVINAANPTEPVVTNSVTLAENIVDVAPLPDGWVAEVIGRYDAGDTLLRLSHPDSEIEGGAIALPFPYISNTFVWNNAVAVVAAMYEYVPEYRSYYLVLLVDCTDQASPAIIGRWQAPLQPWWGGGWYDRPMVDGMAEKDALYYPGGYGGDGAYLAGDYLVLRGTGERYDITFGDTEPWQGVALVDLAGVDATTCVGLGYENVMAVNVAEGQVLITTKREMGNDDQQRRICAYYLRSLNPATLEITRSVNVPGVFLHRLPESKRLLFADQQYARDWQTVTILRSAEMVGSTVRLLDSAKLPPGYWMFMADGAHVYYSGYCYEEYYDGDGDGDDVVEPEDPMTGEKVYYYYSGGHLLGSYTLSRSGMFSANQEVLVSASWINLLGTRESDAYLSVGSAAVAKYDFSSEPPGVDALFPVMGYPQRARFGENAAYVPLGYSGLAIMDY